MREICTSGSEEGAGQSNAPSLPLSGRMRQRQGALGCRVGFRAPRGSGASRPGVRELAPALWGIRLAECGGSGWLRSRMPRRFLSFAGKRSKLRRRGRRQAARTPGCPTSFSCLPEESSGKFPIGKRRECPRQSNQKPDGSCTPIFCCFRMKDARGSSSISRAS